MEMFFSGQVNKEKTLTYFQHVNFSPNSVLNVFDSFKQRMFLDSIF